MTSETQYTICQKYNYPNTCEGLALVYEGEEGNMHTLIAGILSYCVLQKNKIQLHPCLVFSGRSGTLGFFWDPSRPAKWHCPLEPR